MSQTSPHMGSRKRVGLTDRVAACMAACIVGASAAPAYAQDDTQRASVEGAASDPIKTKFIIDDADPESHVPSAKEALSAPLQMGYWVMMIADKAEAAEKRGELSAAVKYYRAMAKAVPDRAVAFAKACAAHQTLGDREQALSFCRNALSKHGVTIDDHARFVQLLLGKQGALSAAEVNEADAVLAHVVGEIGKLATQPLPLAPDLSEKARAKAEARAQSEQHATNVLIAQLQCRLGVRLEDRQRLQACTARLRSLAPRDSKTLAFDFALSLLEQDFDKAGTIIAGAKTLGVPGEAIELMQTRLEHTLAQRPLWRRLLSGDVGRAWLAAALVLLVAAVLLARGRFTTARAA